VGGVLLLAGPVESCWGVLVRLAIIAAPPRSRSQIA
jgi:hypothetical protein